MPRALDEFVDSPDTADASPVLNQQPTIRNTSYKLAIIGEAPGAQECIEGRPFVGASGKLLTQLLSRAGILRDACFVGNICQHRPPGNDISAFSRQGTEIQSGLAALRQDLDLFQPNICLLLGKTALWAAKGVDEIGDWRGSLFMGTCEPFIARKCIASYHPAACLRQWEWSPLLMFDLKKALAEAVRPELVLPERDLIIDLSVEEILSRLDQIRTAKAPISVDIEGYWNALSCISIATSATHSFIIPFTDLLSNSIWPADDEVRLWQGLSQVLADPNVPKIMQNGLYDRFALQYGHNCIVKGRQEDTMLKFWELYAELEKSLAFQCSIVTQEPYYKFERKVGDKATHYRYCCKDSAVTYEISAKLDKWLDSTSRKHYLFNIDLLNPVLFMELRGIRYDTTKAQAKLTQTTHAINELQSEIDLVTNRGIPLTASRSDILSQVQSAICYKRNPNQPKKGREGEWERAESILKEQGEVSKADRGFLAAVVGSGLNIKGAEFKKLLYEELGLPKQYHEITGELTANYQALLKLSKKSNHPVLPLALDLGELRTRAQMLGINADPDGRIRCGYNVVGTETGRLTCYTSPTGSGYNLQTIPAENHLKPLDHPLRSGMRDLFVADEGCYMFQCDLSGADGYTVAAHLANLGDSTMLEDYKAGIKPAKVLCYMLRHGAASLNGKTRVEIKELTKEVEKESWQYFACKIGQHGTSYLMGARKLVNQIFIQSEGKVSMSESDVRDLQRLFTVRYHIKLWHDWITRFLSKQPYPPKLTSPSGHTRRFFGRYNEILGEALAHEPQSVTTYATNLATINLWTDPDNRIGSTKTQLRVEPLHQIHDAILGQFKVEDTAWAVAKIKQWFNNKLIIAGQEIVIPFEGAFGLDWSLDKQSKKGDIV